ncbi:MAG: glycosyltransferase family 2 protein [Pontiellaceae bacterium]|jgi:glycosyltransferase involved in cell wall biosynthesis|nr:glycosyltransferase family 2 protein [Pontiellaceae bacterium]
MSDSFKQKIWCVIPVYNNGTTVKTVALKCREQLDHVLVVDDGCTDADLSALFAGTDIQVLRHETNRGKGAALLSALSAVHAAGGRWMLCLDADGQHHPEDIPRFLPVMEQSPDSIIIGARDFSAANVPGGSRFGRQFSNFWIKLECGANVSDSQSGFRAYPVELLAQMELHGNRYDFEVEVLTKAVWYGLSIKEVPVQVTYAPKGERITHFHKWKDNVRLSHRHGLLVSRRLLPWPHKKLVKTEYDFVEFFRHPLRFLIRLLKESATPLELGLSAAVGILLGALPLIGAHTVSILYVTTRLSLNRALALTIQNVCMPPFVPCACILLGHYMRMGCWLVFADLRHVALQEYLVDWLLGSLILAPLLALFAGLLIYRLAAFLRKESEALSA